MPSESAPSPSTKPQLSLVFPARNEAARLPGAPRATGAFLRDRPEAVEILVVDNASRDGTGRVAREHAPAGAALRVLSEPTPGKGRAVRAGMLAARGAFRVACDVDLSMPIADVARFVERLRAGADVVIGSREAAASDVDVPPSRRFAGRQFNRLVRALLLPGLYDTQCGFKGFREAAAEAVFRRQRVGGFAFDVELLCIARRLGLEVEEVAITWRFDADTRVQLLRDGALMTRDVWRVWANLRRGVYDGTAER